VRSGPGLRQPTAHTGIRQQLAAQYMIVTCNYDLKASRHLRPDHDTMCRECALPWPISSMRTTGSMVVGGRYCRCRVQIGGIAVSGHRPGCCTCVLHRSGLTLKRQQSGRSLIPCLQIRSGCRIPSLTWVCSFGGVRRDRLVLAPVVVKIGGQPSPCRPDAVPSMRRQTPLATRTRSSWFCLQDPLW
jgi:hypothetical protein